MISETPVVTAFLERADGRVLLLRRRADASTYPGAWSGVSGYLEAPDPLAEALREVEEETALAAGDVELLAAGKPLLAEGRWLVHPFLFRCREPGAVRLSAENDAGEWLDPSAMGELRTVPALKEAYLQAKLAERVERIAKDDRHGASWLAKEAVQAVCDAVEAGEDPLELARELVRARPAIGSIAGALGRVLVAGRTPEQTLEEAHALIAGRERASATIAVLLANDLDGKTVMTHSASATARAALLHGPPPGKVVCTESEPVGEGRPFSEELAAEGLATELVADEDATHAVQSVDLLLLGADTVFRDGSLVNKIGTCELTKAAKKAGVPVVVACEVLKLSPVEARDAEEERFDLTPPEQITKFVTEEGEFPPEEIGALVDRTPFLREGYELLSGRSI